jgi:4'-phosphopantetheinyl transferase
MIDATSARAASPAVHVWWIDLRSAGRRFGHILGALSPDERRRALRIGPARAREEFAVTRAVLRELLAAQLARPASQLRIACSAHGKPSVPDFPWLEFNVSHSQGRAVVAISREGPVGVDIERIDPQRDVDPLAERCFGERELASLRRLSGARRCRAFFDGWTRKEAFVKALGTGLSHDLRSVAVALGPDERARLLGAEGERWRLLDLDAGTGYAAALVVARGSAATAVRERSWPTAGGCIRDASRPSRAQRRPSSRRRPSPACT